MAEISKTKLLQLRERATSTFRESPLELSETFEATAAKAVLENQTAVFRGLDNWRKDREIEVMWANACDIEVEDCETDNCSHVGNELSTDTKKYKPNLCKQVAFTVNETELRSNELEMDEFISKGTSTALGKLDEWWSSQVLAKLKTFAGVNIDSNGLVKYDETLMASYFNIPLDPAEYVSAYNRLLLLLRNLKQNQMGNSYLINNGNLWLPFVAGDLKQSDGNGRGNKNILDLFNIYFDNKNFIDAGIDEHTFAVSRGAVGFKTVNKNAPQIQELGSKVGQTRYRITSPMLPQVEYDAFYEMVCENGEIKHSFRFETNGLIEQAPLGCEIQHNGENIQHTGVLAYTTQPDEG